MENREARRARRHLQRAHELLDSNGFGEYKKNGFRENDFGGMLDWFRTIRKDPGEDRMSSLDNILTNRAGRETSKTYLEQEAKKIMAKDLKQIEDALMKSVENNDAFMVSLLLENGATIPRGALTLAVENGNLEIVNLLLDKGEAGNLRGRLNSLFIAANIGIANGSKPHFEAAKLILEKGGDDLGEFGFDAKNLNRVFERTLDAFGPKHNTEMVIDLIKVFLSKGAKYPLSYYDYARKEGTKGNQPFWSIYRLLVASEHGGYDDVITSPVQLGRR